MKETKIPECESRAEICFSAPLLLCAYSPFWLLTKRVRLPIATHNLRAPKDDDNAKVVVELGA
jgi:hypothetical protein